MDKIRSYVLLLGLMVGMTSCERKSEVKPKPVVPVTAFQIKPQTIPAIFEFVGVAKSSHPVEIRARVEGYLWSIEYVEGSFLKTGDPMFQLDPRPFIASLEEANGELAKAEASLWRAQKSLDRMTALFPKNAVSQKDLDDATAGVMGSQAAVTAAKANVAQADLNLSFTKIAAPIDGLSSRAVYQQGNLISPNVNGLLAEVSVIDPIWVLFSVSDNELLQGRGEADRHELILPPLEEYSVQLELADGSFFPYLGKLNFKAPTLDSATGSLVIRASFENPKGVILPGQFVRAYLSGAYRPNAIIVPQQAVSQGRDGTYVIVINEDKTITIKRVIVGEWFGNYWIIREGLKEGELIVAEGTNKVIEGSTVEIKSVLQPPDIAPKQGHTE